MSEEVIKIDPLDIKVLKAKEYRDIDDMGTYFVRIPQIAQPLIDDAKVIFKKIEKMLYTAPAFYEVVKAAIPDVSLQAILTDEQKEQLAKGTLKLMTKKDGTISASLVNPETKRIVKNIPLKEVKLTPEITQAIASYSMQMQMVQLSEQLQHVQKAIEEVKQGQENDRLATAYSCQQKLIQAREIRNPELRAIALLKIAQDAEDSRNLLMLSQKTNVKFIMEQPESFFGKVLKGADAETINSRVQEIRDSLCAVNMTTFAEAMAYKELGEPEAARKSLMHYGDFINNTYLSESKIVERLDLIDPSPYRYWSKNIPRIEKTIEALPYVGYNLIEENQNEK